MIFFNKIKTITKQQNIGQRAETKALQYLKRRGLKLLKKNYYCRFGEIDLIMQEKKVIVFIEVRFRKPNTQVSAAESITNQKINKIRKTAAHYLMQYQTTPNCRFDVTAMTHNAVDSGYTIDWIKNAF